MKVEEAAGNIIVTGIVDTLDELRYTENLLNDLTANKKIEMAVSVSTDGAVTDDDSLLEVAEEIADNPELKDKINIRVNKGKVHLSGQVDQRELKEEAENAAAKARGVIAVENQIKVGTNARNEGVDGIFHSQVRNDKEE
nr:BON domain-containing protein [Halocella sp. SP3-1]